MITYTCAQIIVVSDLGMPTSVMFVRLIFDCHKLCHLQERATPSLLRFSLPQPMYLQCPFQILRLLLSLVSLPRYDIR